MRIIPQSRPFISLITIGFVLALSSCGQDQNVRTEAPDTMRFQWHELTTTAAAQIKVINQFGEPIEKAQVLIGSAKGTPFKNNFVETNSAGVAQISAEWVNPAHVTVDAPGFVRQTMLNQKPGNIVLKMNSLYLSPRAELRGEVTQLPVVNGDKQIDFGLVMPALSRADILNFNLDNVISPYQDVLSIAGQEAYLPSNVSLPTQKESYIFNLKIEKPIYRLTIPAYGPKTFYAASGRFPFKEVVNELRSGKAFYELLNYFTITGGGLRDAQILDPQTNLNIPGTELKFTDVIKIQSATVQADEVLLMLAVSEVGGNLITTDVKKIEPNQPASLTSMASKPAYVVSVIKKQTDFAPTAAPSDRISATLMPYKNGEKQSVLSLVASPHISGTDAYVITLPPAPSAAGVKGIAISATISDVYETQDHGSKITLANHRWEVVGLGWESQISLPAWPLGAMSPKRKVEVNFIGSTSNKPVRLDDSIIEAATHVSHSSTEF